ncbi:hypothetical protein BST81_23515 [Leptolyngbya sp. 'hensonii']|uniref:DUF1816 domain-containing protein n=1 Tax=Leptolyngbya sp. 'hensonii' TaxID=1922337 RepID=UPI00094FDF86|nr:DUF1816 domain-containing protein [Leptolyngbya sp. 'hensonii']OLP16029.1 hypothetical protein BST81_23515 [Leptolyngbya sp. 'hensonii']
MKDIYTGVLQVLGLAWWVEVKTDKPRCTYYFGPFESAESAQSAQGGYVEDLEKEGAQGIAVDVKRCKPSSLTVGEDADGKAVPTRVFSGQMQ